MRDDDESGSGRAGSRQPKRADGREARSTPRPAARTKQSKPSDLPPPSASNPPQSASPARRPFLERPVAIVTLIGGCLGILTAIATVFGLPGGSDDEGEQPRIVACLADHGLSQAVDKTEVAAGRIVFRACVWPPPPGAANDGFTEITMASREGPGRSEAEGLTVADVFTTACRDIEVRYLFDNMGTFVPEQPVRVTKGEIRRVEGGSIWFPRNRQEAEIYSPRRDEFVVLSAGRYRIDSARCVE
jgi:hypothetical protein